MDWKRTITDGYSDMILITTIVSRKVNLRFKFEKILTSLCSHSVAYIWRRPAWSAHRRQCRNKYLQNIMRLKIRSQGSKIKDQRSPTQIDIHRLQVAHARHHFVVRKEQEGDGENDRDHVLCISLFSFIFSPFRSCQWCEWLRKIRLFIGSKTIQQAPLKKLLKTWTRLVSDYKSCQGPSVRKWTHQKLYFLRWRDSSLILTTLECCFLSVSNYRARNAGLRFLISLGKKRSLYFTRALEMSLCHP